jgi:glycerol kinase
VLFGLTRGTSAADLGRATLEGVAYQVADLIDAAAQDAGQKLSGLRVDGGMARNAWFLQCQADVLGLPVLASPHSEATALGAAYLAGLAAGVWSDTEQLRALGGEARAYEPVLAHEEREKRLRRWRRAVRAVVAYYQEGV